MELPVQEAAGRRLGFGRGGGVNDQATGVDAVSLRLGGNSGAQVNF
jgi:hypothetical protein